MKNCESWGQQTGFFEDPTRASMYVANIAGDNTTNFNQSVTAERWVSAGVSGNTGGFAAINTAAVADISGVGTGPFFFLEKEANVAVV